jgi:hypothetical protein
LIPNRPAAVFYPAERAEFRHSRLNISLLDFPFKPISALNSTNTLPLPPGSSPFELKGGFL